MFVFPVSACTSGFFHLNLMLVQETNVPITLIMLTYFFLGSTLKEQCDSAIQGRYKESTFNLCRSHVGQNSLIQLLLPTSSVCATKL